MHRSARTDTWRTTHRLQHGAKLEPCFPRAGIHDDDGRQKFDAHPRHLREVVHHAAEPRRARGFHDEIFGIERVGDRKDRYGEVLLA